jgi:MoaA/NifB/PqqE/SkfB family radical SAM enzyme
MKNPFSTDDGDIISKTFCILPWIHLNTWPNGNVYPCCLTDWRESVGDMKENTLEEIWNNHKMTEMRRQMLSGEKPHSCRKCYQQEEYDVVSTRQSSNRWYADKLIDITKNTTPDGYNDDFKLIYWDFRFSNICNFKCRMCGSLLSSKWYEDEVKIFGGSMLPQAIINVNDHSKTNINHYLDKFINEVEEIYFAGGEPLLMEEHYYILEKLIEVGNTKCRIRYNTNMGFLKFKQWDNIELWKNFKDENGNSTVSIFASIDGINETAEYIRKGTKWKIVEGNIKRCIENGLNFHISCTTNVFNVFHIPDLVNYIISIGLSPFHIQLNNVLTNPSYYHINILTPELKNKVKILYEEHLKTLQPNLQSLFQSKYDSIINFLDEENNQDVENIRYSFKYMTHKLDEGREESFVETFPHYKEWYDSIELKDKTEIDKII